MGQDANRTVGLDRIARRNILKTGVAAEIYTVVTENSRET
jgi:hypothetical protein